MACNAHRHLKGLCILKLTRGSFTDGDLRVLTGLTALRSLSLKECNNITDKGLKAVVVPLSKESLAQVNVQGCSRLTSLSLVSLKQESKATSECANSEQCDVE